MTQADNERRFLWIAKPQGWVGLKFRAENALRDLGDRLQGRCCAAPNYMVDGGYHFWRCGLRRGHDGPHRSINYLWGPGGSVYAPIDNAPPGCDRNPVETRRQRKSRKAWHALADAKRQAQETSQQSNLGTQATTDRLGWPYP